MVWWTRWFPQHDIHSINFLFLKQNIYMKIFLILNILGLRKKHDVNKIVRFLAFEVLVGCQIQYHFIISYLININNITWIILYLKASSTRLTPVIDSKKYREPNERKLFHMIFYIFTFLFLKIQAFRIPVLIPNVSIKRKIKRTSGFRFWAWKRVLSLNLLVSSILIKDAGKKIHMLPKERQFSNTNIYCFFIEIWLN